MKALHDTYPIFEANQVLTNIHLNEMFNYLDEQERLTRTSLIGIGIVCGLDIAVHSSPQPTIQLSRGCGITSTGYLIMEPDDVELRLYREYRLPADVDYPPFTKTGESSREQYPLWELFPAGEPDTNALDSPDSFLNDKAVLLFLELKKESLRTCNPTECDDKGHKISASLRRLLIRVDDLQKIVTDAHQLPDNLTFADLETSLTLRLNLPELRLPRYDVPNTGSATSFAVLAAFHTIFQTSKLVSHTAKALSDTYDAFKPIISQIYPSNPFAGFKAKFKFLETVPIKTDQVRFLPYYYDFFADLLKAYDEFRKKGMLLLSVCCPPEDLFPRHLMAGLASPSEEGDSSILRTHFTPSPAINDNSSRKKELIQLVRRLVEMIDQFTDKPPLPAQPKYFLTDNQIRITPTSQTGQTLSEAAIPYYYRMDGSPPLYHLWSYEKTALNRAHYNLGYRSDKYQPPAPAFVTDPLSYNLDIYDFLRIEGHLGKKVNTVIETLLSLKARYRLPIDIIALRAGAFEETIEIDLTTEECRFQDLETLYDTLRTDILNSLCEGVRFLYDISMPKSNLAISGDPPHLSLLQKCAPNFIHKANTVGAWYEQYLDLIHARPYIDVDQGKIDNSQVLTVYCGLFAGTTPPEDKFYAHIVSVYYLSQLAEILPSDLSELQYSEFENKYQDLIGLVRFFRSDTVKNISNDLTSFIPQEDLIDHFDRVLFSCKLEPVKAVYTEYQRRISEIKKKQFLSFFLKDHPGIQHNSGVPIGGTFILVYHQQPKQFKPGMKNPLVKKPAVMTSDAENTYLANALKRISANPKLSGDKDVRYMIGMMTGQIPDKERWKPSGLTGDLEKIIEETVSELTDGTVIADFYLPYLCCSDCTPIQYVLPTPPVGLEISVACTAINGTAEVSLTPKGGSEPYTYQLDSQPFKPLEGNLLLNTGTHTITIRDSAGSESASQEITIPEPLIIGEETYSDIFENNSYQVMFPISGGTPPYSVDSGTVTGSNYTSEEIKNEESIIVKITDRAGCSAHSEKFTHELCQLPCAGNTKRCGFRFWIPEPNLEYKREFKRYSAKVITFSFELPNGESVELAGEIESIINAKPDKLNERFGDVVKGWLDQINELIAKTAEQDRYFHLEYEKVGADSVGILWIEYFDCLQFKFGIHVEYQRPELEEVFDFLYTPEGTAISEPEADQRRTIPPFDCTLLNKCTPDQPIIAPCKGVNLKLKIKKTLSPDGHQLVLTVKAPDTGTPLHYLWEVQDCSPALSNDEKPKFFIKTQSPSFKLIWLYTFTEAGCRTITKDTIQLPQG